MSTLPVIVAVDGSDDSLRALDRALDAARRRTAPLRVVHVRTRLAGLSDRPVTEYLTLEGAPASCCPNWAPPHSCWSSVREDEDAAGSPACCRDPTAWPPPATPSAR